MNQLISMGVWLGSGGHSGKHYEPVLADNTQGKGLPTVKTISI